MIAPGRKRWVSVGIEVLLFSALAVGLLVILLPSIRRGLERARRLGRVEQVRSRLENTRREVAPASLAAFDSSLPMPASLPHPEPTGQEPVSEGNISECDVNGFSGAIDTRQIERSVPKNLVAAECLHAAKDDPKVFGDIPIQLDPVGPELASWGNIGGCGVGGSGGGGDVRWIGRRAPGGRIESELLLSYSAGEDLQTTKINLKLSGDIPGRFNIGVQVPYLYSRRYDEGYWQPISPTPIPLEVSSMGDVTLLVSRKFGMIGDTVANISIGLPTAPHDLEKDSYYLPPDTQPGRGKLTFSLGIEHMLERDYGPITFGGSYNYSGGENDLGNYKADSISTYYYFSYKTDTLVHSLGANLTFALREDRSIVTTIGEQATVLVGLQYGLEFSFPRFPLFFSVLGTLSGDGIDSYTLALGVVTSF